MGTFFMLHSTYSSSENEEAVSRNLYKKKIARGNLRDLN